ncbi:MAG: MHYT domain-containing protein [Caulobacterales bacterium]
MRIIACLTMQHDLLLVALAALICVVGALITMRLYQRCLHAERGAATSWIFLGAVAGGSTIWCTHFVAMLAYRPGVEVSYDPALTGVSLAVAISSCALSFAAAQMRLRRAPELGGAVFGAGVSAMHYAGMSAFGANGVIEWSAIYVIL